MRPIFVGLIFGPLIGVMIDNIPLGLPIGLGLGALYEVLTGYDKDGDMEEDDKQL
ncbi:hypothetical protein [Erythrobacter crassostreae]|uniref:Glycine zipper family protein n=1 Tax=Erythrobacter crassostreae TaxID=2828328 RepID=A0A9X1F798_9SPHN|nr:hypothetical protein [Erythrobacter crassostrea]MBV7260090.1 hypothetical protein [Erythrobacter crassostrea]